MAKHLITGKKGEALAKNYLESKNWIILNSNWRTGRAEVDIIAKDDNFLVFVEVKTRTGTSYGHPAAFVTSHKEELLVEAAQVYMEQIQHRGEFRFDIISVLLSSGRDPLIEHFQDAFFPGF